MAGMMIPVTALSAYLYCKRKLFLESVLKIAEPPKKAIVKGTIRHQAYDTVNQIEEKIVKSIKTADFEEIIRLYVREYSRTLKQAVLKNKHKLRSVGLALTDAYEQIWRFFSSEAEARAANVFRFIEKENVFGEELWQKLTPKIRSEVRISSEKIGLRGIIDQVHEHNGQEAFVPVELKTGKMPKEGVWPGHKVQIAAYMIMLSEKLNAKVNVGRIRYLDPNETKEIRMNPFLKDEIIRLAGKVRELTTSRKLPDFTDNENKCKACGIRRICHNKAFLEEKMKILTLA